MISDGLARNCSLRPSCETQIDAYIVHGRPQFQRVPARFAAETLVSAQPHIHRKRATVQIPRTVHGAGATPLVPAAKRRLELQQLQDVLHLDPLAKQPEVYAWHAGTSSPVNREEEPVLAAPDAASLNDNADSTVRLARRGRTCRGSSAAESAPALPGRQASRIVSIRHMIVAVRRVNATRAMFAPRRRLIR
jgi:hypothetical protein